MPVGSMNYTLLYPSRGSSPCSEVNGSPMLRGVDLECVAAPETPKVSDLLDTFLARVDGLYSTLCTRPWQLEWAS